MVKLRARCLLLGDAAVGKSSLSHIFYSDGTLFQKNYSMTTGVELMMKSVNIPETNDTVEVYIVDTPGKETLVDGCEKMWGEPSLLCLVFDLTNEQSFVNCGGWMERARAHCHGLHVPARLHVFEIDVRLADHVVAGMASSEMPSLSLGHEGGAAAQHHGRAGAAVHRRAGVLVGNKSDLSARREVQTSVAQEWAQSQGLEYHETSAKEMENCDAPLLSLARAFHSLYQEHRENIQNLSPG